MTTPRWYTESPRSAVVATALAVVGSFVLGGLTSPAQALLPDALSSFANSSGGWTMLAFVLVWAGRARPLLAALLGIVTFEGLIEGYALVTDWRGFYYAAPFSSIYSLIGLVAGPVLGVAASLVRHGNPAWRTLAVTPLSAVLLGEGVYGLTVIADSTSPVYWIVQIALAATFLVTAAARRRPGATVVLVAIALVVLGASVFWSAYQLLSYAG